MNRDPWYVTLRREVALWSILIAGGLFGLFFLALIVDNTWFSNDPWLTNVAKKHYPAAIGLPLAAIAALLVVSVFRITNEPIEFELLGLRLKGGAGPTILWVLVFLAMVLGIFVLWDKHSGTDANGASARDGRAGSLISSLLGKNCG